MAGPGNFNATSRYQQYGSVTIDHREDNSIVKWWFLTAVAWLPAFTTFGFFLAIKFIFPDFLPQSYFTFGRLRPFHFDSLIQGFLTSFLLAAMFYVLPRVSATNIRFPALAKALAVLWNAAVLAGGIWVLFGGSQGREYAELPWAIDIALIVLDIALAVVVIATVAARREPKLYVSTWFYLGTLIWFPVFYGIGNVIWQPPQGAINGINDAIINWYYGHNFFGIWITTLGLAAWYYMIPVIIKRPLYSVLLGLLSFFGQAFFYTGVGAHHLLQAPIPDFVKTIAVTMSIMMIVPVMAFSANMFMTMRGSWRRAINNPTLSFALVGAIAYVATSLQGTFQSTRSTNAFLHFSQWTVAHSHLSMLGAFAFLAMGLGFWLMPKITGRSISLTSMRVTFWMAFMGFIFFFLSMTILGLQQNSNWWSHINVVETLPSLRVMFFVRAASGGVVVIAAFIFARTLISGLFSRMPETEAIGEPPEVPAPVTPRPGARDIAWQGRASEGMNSGVVVGAGSALFVLMTFMVVAMPYMFAPQNPGGTGRPLTELETRGEQLYKENGCFYCHSQFTREEDWAMGLPSNPGDFYYSVPNFLGSERTGPTLARIGGKRPTGWHLAHFADPRAMEPRSIMPTFHFLSANDTAALAAYVRQLGGENLTAQYFPDIPQAYQGNTSNPNNALMSLVSANYNAQTQVYSGPAAVGLQWRELFEQGKTLFTQKCLSCHGCSGNGEGPYARNTLAHPANLHDRISQFPQPQDEWHFWRVATGVPGTMMPPWIWTYDNTTIWNVAAYEKSFVAGAIRTVPHAESVQESLLFASTIPTKAPIAGTQEQFQHGQQLYGLYCQQCHGPAGKGDGPASAVSPGGYINPVPFNLEAAGIEFSKYGQYVWTVGEGMETTNMPPWKEVLTTGEIYDVIFFIQAFSTPQIYQSRWAPLYTDPFARNLGR